MHTIFFQAPHYPEQPSLEYERLYDSVTFPLPEQYGEIDPYTPTFSPYSPRPFENCPDYQRYGGKIQEYLKLYYGMVSQIDANVGRILDALDELGIADDTAVLFSSDHGDMQGSHGKKNKCLPFERSCGIPLILKVPGMRQAPRVSVPVSSVDFYTTCLDIAGVPARPELPGVTLLPFAEGKTEGHPPIFAENYQDEGRWYMLRDKRFKLTVEMDTRAVRSLFDMSFDPEESRNLAGNPEYAQIQRQLVETLEGILKN